MIHPIISTVAAVGYVMFGVPGAYMLNCVWRIL